MPSGTPSPHFGAVTAARASTFDWFWSSRIWLLYRKRISPGNLCHGRDWHPDLFK
jgi:hypothetical protein